MEKEINYIVKLKRNHFPDFNFNDSKSNEKFVKFLQNQISKNKKVKVKKLFTILTENEILALENKAKHQVESPFYTTNKHLSILYNNIKEYNKSLIKFKPISTDLNAYYLISISKDTENDFLEFILKKDYFSSISKHIEPNVADYPDVSDQQTYLRAPIAGNAGVNADFAFSIRSADGTGVTLIDVEQGWDTTHLDLPTNITRLSRIIETNTEHGTNTLGIISATHNNQFCKGIAPNTTVLLSGYEDIRDPNTTIINIYNAILLAINNLKHGDILLLEIELGGQPLEYKFIFIELLNLATALGIVVIEPAGNGGQDLDQSVNDEVERCGTLIYAFDRRSSDFIDSGAIMVGGCDNDRSLCISNYGNRIDCFSLAENVVTLGNGNTINRTFNGSSSASAIIAGVASVIQSYAFQFFGEKLHPLMLRFIFQKIGNIASDFNFPNGKLPDLEQIFRFLIHGLADIFIRDNFADTGGVSSGILCQSPDIILDYADIPNPQNVFTDYNNDYAKNLDRNQENYLYVRFKNASNFIINNAKAKVYYTQASLLSDPSQWNLIGESSLANISRNTVAIFPAIHWDMTILPAGNHFCTIAIISCDEDPFDINPVRINFQNNINAYISFICNNNNVAWRNFLLIDNPQNIIIATFVPKFRSGEMTLHVENNSNLPLNINYHSDNGKLVFKSKTVKKNSSNIQSLVSKEMPYLLNIELQFPTSELDENTEIKVFQKYNDITLGMFTIKKSKL